jgi:hypothetical protein
VGMAFLARNPADNQAVPPRRIFPRVLESVRASAGARAEAGGQSGDLARNYLVPTVIRHPEDARNAEALGLSEKATRYSCGDDETSGLVYFASREV